ncbi:MAG: NAD-dependent epimerase/dehydratase [Marmoricola sp.]|nr:NAD-dependent epimerase/dehydratase [Marmoricola sp.]
MRIFVTGATGWIGSAVVPELLDAGHQVVALARSDQSGATLEANGIEVVRGSLDDPDTLHAAAAASDGVIHLAYLHDFSRMPDAARMDLAAIEAFGAALEGTDRPLLMASGTLGLAPGRVGTEADRADVGVHPRIANAHAALALADRGVRSLVVRFAPTVHGAGDHGFVSTLVDVARSRGVSAYVGDGESRWSAVHRDDAAWLVRLAIDHAPAGSVLHAVGETGVPTRAIAEAIGRGLDLPVVSVPAENAVEHFDWIGMFFGTDATASNDLTRELLGWDPAGPGLIEDLDAGSYFVPVRSDAKS